MVDRDLRKWDLIDTEWDLLHQIKSLLVVRKIYDLCYFLLTFINNNHIIDIFPCYSPYIP